MLNRHRLTVKLWVVLYQHILEQYLWHRDKNYIMLVYVWSESKQNSKSNLVYLGDVAPAFAFCS